MAAPKRNTMTRKSDGKFVAASKKLLCHRRSVVPQDDWTTDIIHEDDAMPLLDDFIEFEKSWSFEEKNF